VVAHRPRVALAAVALPARAQLSLRRTRGALHAGGPGGGERKPAAGAPVKPGRLPGVQQVEHGVDVVDTELAGHVRAAKAELPRGAQRMPQRRGRAHGEARSAAVG
jgi:hypothetical protein